MSLTLHFNYWAYGAVLITHQLCVKMCVYWIHPRDITPHTILIDNLEG